MYDGQLVKNAHCNQPKCPINAYLFNLPQLTSLMLSNQDAIMVAAGAVAVPALQILSPIPKVLSPLSSI
jgi:hypothetical protein